MKTIAGLTMMYLPTTFIATIFTTGFFDFSEGDLSIKPDIWKLIVAGGVMTTITIAVWVYLNKRGVPGMLKYFSPRPATLASTSATAKAPKKASKMILRDLPLNPGHTHRHSSSSPASQISQQSNQQGRGKEVDRAVHGQTATETTQNQPSPGDSASNSGAAGENGIPLSVLPSDHARDLV
jgi:membrane peptidoglycan carboxypeptidase